jgi:hypothetical protein
VKLLKHVWHDERLRGPFLAALPVGGHDGTLASRMKNSALQRRVQAKTGTIANMRALSGFLETTGGEKLVFSIIANHYTGPTSEVDDAAEKALERLLSWNGEGRLTQARPALTSAEIPTTSQIPPIGMQATNTRTSTASAANGPHLERLRLCRARCV